MSPKTSRILLAVLLVATVLTTPIAAAAGSGGALQPESRDARLAIEQPGYVDGDVSRQQIDGSRAYVVSGDRQLIQPENFQTDAVVDYGVEEDSASLSFNENLGVFELSTTASGTYHVYWTVREEYAATNTTDTNNTTTNGTEMRRVEYSALMRVDNADTVHLSEEERDQLEENSELGETVNATLSDIRDKGLPLVDNTGSDRELFQKVAGLYVTYGKPLSWLTGSFSQLMLLIVMTPGGWLLVGLTFLGFGLALYRARKKLTEHEVTEAEESTLAERQAEIDDYEQKQAAENWNWTQMFENPNAAAAFERFAPTPRDGFEKLRRTGIAPEVWIRDRLEAMGLAGWHAQVSRDPDTVDDDQGRIVDAELLGPDVDTREIDGEVVEIRDELDALVDVLDWECDELREFDLSSADIDWSETSTKPLTMDPTKLSEELEVQFDRFDDETVPSQYLLELVESLEQHPYTDPDGEPVTAREVLNDWLRASQYMGDVAKLPGTTVMRQHIERALADHDPSERAQQYADDVKRGAL